MFIQLNQQTINSEEVGPTDAIPVLFLHGFPFDLHMWDEQLKVVGEEFRAIAYDIPGHGKSSVGDGVFSIDGHVDDLLALLVQLNINKPVLVGLSMGGYIALRAMERHPEKFRGLVLCDTKSEADNNEAKLARYRSIQSLKADGHKVFAKDFLKKVFTTDTFDKRPDVVEKIHETILNTPPINMERTLMALSARTDSTPSLFNIKIPSLILVGEKDEITPPLHAQLMHEKITGSLLEVIPNAGHLSNLENPEFFNEKLMGFLRNNY